MASRQMMRYASNLQFWKDGVRVKCQVKFDMDLEFTPTLFSTIRNSTWHLTLTPTPEA